MDNNTNINEELIINNITKAVETEFKKMKGSLIAEHKKQLEQYLAIGNKFGEIVKLMNNKIKTLNELIDETNKAIIKNTEETMKNDNLLKEIKLERARCEKATDIMKLAGTIELEQYAAEAAIKAEEKAFRDDIANRKAVMSDEFDARRDALQAGRSQYYPELDQELDKLTEEILSETADEESLERIKLAKQAKKEKEEKENAYWGTEDEGGLPPLDALN